MTTGHEAMCRHERRLWRVTEVISVAEGWVGAVLVLLKVIHPGVELLFAAVLPGFIAAGGAGIAHGYQGITKLLAIPGAPATIVGMGWFVYAGFTHAVVHFGHTAIPIPILKPYGFVLAAVGIAIVGCIASGHDDTECGRWSEYEDPAETTQQHTDAVLPHRDPLKRVNEGDH